MGQWLCYCGNPMNDHNYPNENGFIAFSDYEWDDISCMTDDENNINWMDIPPSQYEVYKCPKCGRLMIFGESNRFLSYKPEFNIEDAKKILTESVNIEFHSQKNEDMGNN